MINHFERLEFIGDRVLGLVVGEILYKEFPKAPEGELARRLAWLVCRDTVAEIAKLMTISENLKYARATENNATQWITFLSDACEALIGAVYFDGGIINATKLIQKFWVPLLHQKEMSMKDPKTELQEYVQSQFKILPKYKITQQIGPAHQPEITVECKVKKFTVVATASNRKAAENNCAQTMLQKLKNG
jgi:ribonuclease-3